MSVGKNRNWIRQSRQNKRVLHAARKLVPVGFCTAISSVLTSGYVIIIAELISNIVAQIPIEITAICHPKRTIKRAITGGNTTCPTAVPTLTTPVITPRRPSNQRAIVDSVTTSWVLIPKPIDTANITNRCQGWVTCEISA